MIPSFLILIRPHVQSFFFFDLVGFLGWWSVSWWCDLPMLASLLSTQN